MKKSHIFTTIGLVLLLSFFSFIAIQQELNLKNLTGFAVYSGQPNSTEGTDTYIREDFPNNNFGSNAIAQIGKTASDNRLRTLLKFDLSEVPSENTIIDSNFSIYINNLVGTETEIKAYLLTSDWTESEATWNDRQTGTSWGSAGGVFTTLLDTQTITSTETWYNFSITTAVRNWKNGTKENYGIILTSESLAGNYTEISTSDSVDETLRPKIAVEHTENANPTINTFEDDSSSENPTLIGQEITFTLNWTDLENDNAQIYVCNTSNITFENGCEDGEFCSTTLSSTNPATCEYTTQETDNRTTNYFVKVCDSYGCSPSENSSFYINHAPTISLTQPNGGETVNQSQGNYTIQFSVSDADSDSLTANIYYGTTQNSTTNTLATNINLTESCTDPDENTATSNDCEYSWNSSGIYGDYFLTIITNDTYTTTNDSSDSSFEVRSVEDNLPPEISNIEIDSTIWSGKETTINATITDENMQTARITFNYSQANITLTNSSEEFTGNFLAPEIGTYKFRIFAEDRVGNSNYSEWQEFSVVEPNATAQNETYPSTTLPYHTIKIQTKLNASNSLKNVYAYLNVPEGFTFLDDYSQNNFLGNFSENEIKNSTWFLSSPLEEGTYTLNVTYTDGYSNSWQSSDFELTVTSSIGGYEIELNGYPEVETSNDYYAESFFKQSGQYLDADSMQIEIYDASGNLVVGPASMTKKETGKYNYSYAVGPSVTEGQWETRINATKNSVSYYTNEFWKVVGGPFDVRDITILNNTNSSINISFIAENTGGANKDLIMTWELTRADNDATLEEGGETFMVPANSEKTWYISTDTEYIGQVKITIIGYYSGTEKAGGYKLFSTVQSEDSGDDEDDEEETPQQTPSGGGGGGSTPTPVPQIENKTSLDLTLEKIIYLTKNIEKTVTLKLKNTGDTLIENLKISLEGINPSNYELSQENIEKLNPSEQKEIEIKFLITDLTGDIPITIKAESEKIKESEESVLSILSIIEFIQKEIDSLTERIDKIKNSQDQEAINEIKVCEEILNTIKDNLEKEEFINARDNINSADTCIKEIEKDIQKEEPKMENYWIWIITWALILILIIVLVIIVYLLYKKLNLSNFLQKQKQEFPQQPQEQTTKSEYISKNLKNIKDKLGNNKE